MFISDDHAVRMMISYYYAQGKYFLTKFDFCYTKWYEQVNLADSQYSLELVERKERNILCMVSIW